MGVVTLKVLVNHQAALLFSISSSRASSSAAQARTFPFVNMQIQVVLVGMKCAHPDLAELVALLVQCHHHLIHYSSFTGSQKGATIPFGVAPVGAVQLVVILWQCHRFPDDHILSRNTDTRSDEAVIVQFFVDGVSHTWEALNRVLRFSLLPLHRGSPETTTLN